MKVVVKYQKGKRKPFNIRQYNNKLFYVFRGSVSQHLNGYSTITDAELFIDQIS